MRILLIAALVAVPLAAGQVPSSDFAMTAEGPAMLAPEAATPYNLTITLGCAEVIENSGEADVTVSLLDPPEAITAEPVELHFGIEDCIGQESITQTASIDIESGQEAHGLEPFTLRFEAALGDHTAEAEVPDVMVDYLPGHTMTPDGDQTFQVTGGEHTFDLVLDFTSNAKTMVMFEDKQVSGTGGLTGLKAQIVDVETTRSVTNNIVFTAPEGAWTEETVSFYTYSHCLDGPDCGENFARTITWTFQNADPPTTEAQESDEKNTPPVGWPFLALAMVGAAAFARRRNA